MKADFHLHTTASDGRFSPEKVVQLAAERGLEVIAITDHDSVAGVIAAVKAAESFPPLKVIPGVEINTDIPNGEVHILGYFIDYRSQELRQTLHRLRQARRRRARKIVAKLAQLGIEVEWERVKELSAGGSIGRPHIAQAMLEQGYISRLQEAFNRYIGRYGPAYVERERLSPVGAVKLVAKAGGLPVLAHPAGIDNLEELLEQLIAEGLVGLEAYYNGYGQRTVKFLVNIADKHGLIITGGSDFHGFGGGNETPVGGRDIPSVCLEQLVALAEQSWAKVVTQ
ncbi:MAG: PHP domain-containing protein [Dehalococcoidia bacterium]|jgi:predicted metal-dependent phosphoesterase TrpH|nr:PHP domain-containing protein [Chloroflexota bacterium]MCK4243207.1 PHP domain-containing protein [Dehalococcoidia bacterium]